jgi:pyrroloquinoline-quinone synthase
MAEKLADFKKFDELIQSQKYSKGSFVQEVVGGNVTRDGLKRWAIQKYFQTYHQNRAFSAIHANAPYEDVRQFEMEQLIGEETGLEDGSDSHYNLMKRFAFAMGATEEEIAATEVGGPVQEFVNYLIGLCLSEHFVYGILAIYINESQTSESAVKLHTAIQERFGVTDHDLEWFLVHSDADIEHSNIARYLIEKYAGEAPDFAKKSLEIIANGTKMWTQLHDYYHTVLVGSGVKA